MPDKDLNSTSRLRTAIITCAVLEIEVAHYVKGLEHVVHVEVLPQGLHNEPPKLQTQLQEAIDRVEQRADVEAIVLGYGLCSRGAEGLVTKRCLLVVPRAHDCITLLLGDKDRYSQYVKESPGTYWYSPGWNKSHTPPGKQRYEELYEKYKAEFGEDNAQFLMEEEQTWFRAYTRAAYVDLGVGATKEDIEYTQQCAQWLGWGFDHQHGDPGLLQALLSGPWDDRRFLVIRPGQTLRMTADDRVIELVEKK